MIKGIQFPCMKVRVKLASGKLFTTAAKSSLHLSGLIGAYNNQCKILHFIWSKVSDRVIILQAFWVRTYRLPSSKKYIASLSALNSLIKNASLIFNQKEGIQESQQYILR